MFSGFLGISNAWGFSEEQTMCFLYSIFLRVKILDLRLSEKGEHKTYLIVSRIPSMAICIAVNLNYYPHCKALVMHY